MNKSILKMRKELTRVFINKRYSKALNRLQVPVFVVLGAISILAGIKSKNIVVMGTLVVLSALISKLVRELHAEYIYKVKSKNPKWVKMYDVQIEKLMLAKLKTNSVSKDFYDCFVAAEKYSTKHMQDRLEKLSAQEKIAINKIVKERAMNK